jgi:ATP sulfurylase
MLFESLGDIGITPVFFDTVYFSDAQGATVERPTRTDGLREISGRRIRELLSTDQTIPNWCMRGELSQWLVDERNAGIPLIVTG